MKRENPGFIPAAIISKRHLWNITFVSLCVIFSSLLILPEPLNFIPFIIIGGIAFLFISLRFPMIGIFLYMIIFFIRPQELFPNVAIFSYPYEKIVALIVIANIVLEYAVKTRKIEIHDLDKAIIAVLAATFISIVTSIWISLSIDSFQKFFKIVIVYFFLTRLVTTDIRYKWILWLYVISIGFIAVSSTINYYQGNFQTTMGIHRAVGLGESGSAYGDPNTMAASLVLGMPFLYYMARSYRSKLVKLFLLGIMGATLWTVIITGSRGGMLGAFVMLMILGWKSKQKIAAMMAVTLLVILAAALMPQEYYNRMLTITDYNDQNDESGAAVSAQGRIKGLKVGFEIMTKRPLAGAGIGCFPIYNHQYHGSGLNAHNLLGQLMGELGMVGLAAFAFLTYLIFKNLKFIERNYEDHGWAKDLYYYVSQAIRTSMYLLLFLGLFGHNAYRFNWYIFAAFVAIMMEFINARIPVTPQLEESLPELRAVSNQEGL